MIKIKSIKLSLIKHICKKLYSIAKLNESELYQRRKLGGEELKVYFSWKAEIL